MSQSSNRASFLTIVSGLPRSGTSMMMRMLAAGGKSMMVDDVRQPNEDNPQGYYEFEPVKRTKTDPGWLAGSEGKAVKMVYRLLYDLPPDRQYCVLFMQRRLAEVLASQQVMLGRSGEAKAGAGDRQMEALFTSELKKFYDWAARQSHIQGPHEGHTRRHFSLFDVWRGARPRRLQCIGRFCHTCRIQA